MAGKVLINLMTGLEDPERVTVAFLVGESALARGDKVAIWMTKEAVRLALPGQALGVVCEGYPPLAKVFGQFMQSGGELLVCPSALSARELDQGALIPTARIAGPASMFEWIGDDYVTAFSY